MFPNRISPSVIPLKDKKTSSPPPYQSEPDDDDDQLVVPRSGLRQRRGRSSDSSQPSAWSISTTPDNDTHKSPETTVATTPALVFSNSIPASPSPSSGPRAPVKTFSFYYNKCQLTLRIFAGDSPSATDIATGTNAHDKSQALFTPTFHEWRSLPDVVLHSGGDKKGPVQGTADFRWSRDLTLGFGGQGDGGEVDEVVGHSGVGVFEKMENVSKYWGHRRYVIEMAVGNDSSPAEKVRRRFEWRRTRSERMGVVGSGKITNYNYKIVDVEAGEVVAVYLENVFKSFRKKGKLVLYRDPAEMGKNWELMLLLGSCGLIEKAWRRARNYSMGHGGGGGGG